MFPHAVGQLFVVQFGIFSHIKLVKRGNHDKWLVVWVIGISVFYDFRGKLEKLDLVAQPFAGKHPDLFLAFWGRAIKIAGQGGKVIIKFSLFEHFLRFVEFFVVFVDFEELEKIVKKISEMDPGDKGVISQIDFLFKEFD